MTDKPTEHPEPSFARRDFLRSAVTASSSALVLALVTNGAAADEPVPTSDAASNPQPQSQGYRLTRHVADYYRTASL